MEVERTSGIRNANRRGSKQEETLTASPRAITAANPKIKTRRILGALTVLRHAHIHNTATRPHTHVVDI